MECILHVNKGTSVIKVRCFVKIMFTKILNLQNVIYICRIYSSHSWYLIFSKICISLHERNWNLHIEVKSWHIWFLEEAVWTRNSSSIMKSILIFFIDIKIYPVVLRIYALVHKNRYTYICIIYVDLTA